MGGNHFNRFMGLKLGLNLINLYLPTEHFIVVVRKRYAFNFIKI